MASCGFGTTFGFDGDVTMLGIGPSHIYTKADIFLVFARKFTTNSLDLLSGNCLVLLLD